MTDLISRADAICEVLVNDGIDNIVNRIKALPAADVVSREDYHNLLMASNDIDRALRKYQEKEEAEAVHKPDYSYEAGMVRRLKEALSADAVHIETYRELYEKYVELKHASAEAVQGYTEWLEKIIVDNEGANEWLCEDTLDLEWCENNCHYSSIQAECLRHLYAISKGGDEE